MLATPEQLLNLAQQADEGDGGEPGQDPDERHREKKPFFARGPAREVAEQRQILQSHRVMSRRMRARRFALPWAGD